jgi:hypothetical protein
MGVLVPFEHGINSLAQLRAASLINTARVYPNVLKPLAPRLATGSQDLGQAPAAPISLSGGPVPELLEGDFLGAPGMRKNRVWWDGPVKFAELERSGMDEPHVGGPSPAPCIGRYKRA